VGLEITIERTGPCSLAALVAALVADGWPVSLMMVDGALVAPGVPPPASWRDVRLRTPAGTVTLVARPNGVGVVVFGNAAEPLTQAQRRVAAAIGALP
jgi:hypothetical protein